MGRTSGTSIRSCTLTVSPGRSAGSAAPQPEHWSGRCSTTSSGVSLITRLWPSCPGLAPPGFERSRCSFRSVEGGLEEVREVFSGRCRRSTSSINSSLLRRSSSPRPIPPLNQQKRPTSRAWVIALEERREPTDDPVEVGAATLGDVIQDVVEEPRAVALSRLDGEAGPQVVVAWRDAIRPKLDALVAAAL